MLLVRPQLLTYTAQRHACNMGKVCGLLCMLRERLMSLLKATPQLLDCNLSTLQVNWSVSKQALRIDRSGNGN